MNTGPPNWELAVYALHLLGGELRPVATEDIALKCFQIAPDSFSWVKYPQYPDKEVTRYALTDARKPKNGALVRGRAGRGKGQRQRTKADPALDGWMLTESGVKWLRDRGAQVATELDLREANTHRQEARQKINRIRSHRAFSQFLEQPEGFSPPLGDLAELFRCRVDADWQTWDKRFRVASNLAQNAGDKSILEFLDRCRAAVRSQMPIP